MLAVRQSGFEFSMVNVQLLVAARADPALQDHNGMTALMWAIKEGDIAYVRLLLDPDVTLELPTERGLKRRYHDIDNEDEYEYEDHDYDEDMDE